MPWRDADQQLPRGETLQASCQRDTALITGLGWVYFILMVPEPCLCLRKGFSSRPALIPPLVFTAAEIPAPAKNSRPHFCPRQTSLCSWCFPKTFPQSSVSSSCLTFLQGHSGCAGRSCFVGFPGWVPPFCLHQKPLDINGRFFSFHLPSMNPAIEWPSTAFQIKGAGGVSTAGLLLFFYLFIF